jgi:hypothetical protein
VCYSNKFATPCTFGYLVSFYRSVVTFLTSFLISATGLWSAYWAEEDSRSAAAACSVACLSTAIVAVLEAIGTIALSISYQWHLENCGTSGTLFPVRGPPLY